MSYNFDDSKKVLEEEIKEERRKQIATQAIRADEEFICLSNSFPMLTSILITLVCYFVVFSICKESDLSFKIGLGTFFAFPTISMILQILISKPIKFKLFNGILYVGDKEFKAEDIKSVAITEYSPCYIRTDSFKIRAINFSGYKEYLVEIIPSKPRAEHTHFFMSNNQSAQSLIRFLRQNEIGYGYMEKEPIKFFFYY